MKIWIWCMLFIPCYLQGQTFTEIRELECGDSVHIEQLGYPTWNMPVIVQPPSYGDAVIDGDLWYSLVYQSADNFEGSDTVVVACAHATQITCDTGVYIFRISCSLNGISDGTNGGTSVQVYPNPAHDIVHIRAVTAGCDIILTDMCGRVVAHIAGNDSGEAEISVAALPTGLYQVTISSRHVLLMVNH